jgi:hypothetical protein
MKLGLEHQNRERQKSRSAAVLEPFSQTPVFKESSDSHSVSALCGISASGNVMIPGLIAKRETDHPDADQCYFLPNVRRYASANAFVTRQIFHDIYDPSPRRTLHTGENHWVAMPDLF